MEQVLEIYRITLLSNYAVIKYHICPSFGDLQNYTTLKHPKTRDLRKRSFGDLQNYTTLKQRIEPSYCDGGFGDLQNYTTLKLS